VWVKDEDLQDVVRLFQLLLKLDRDRNRSLSPNLTALINNGSENLFEVGKLNFG